MALTKDERDKLKAELARSDARDKESEEQKWLRGAIADSVKETLTEMLGLDDEDEAGDGKKPSGGGFSISSLFGEPKNKRTA